jgi:hypothetical protein
MALNNPTWGQERVADELSLKLGILVSPGQWLPIGQTDWIRDRGESRRSVGALLCAITRRPLLPAILLRS